MSRTVLKIIEAGQVRDSRTLVNERDLILAAQRGETAAFKDLYEGYKDRIFNLICYTLNDVHQAEDVLQSVFVKVFQALPFFRLESSFLTWIFRVALNECKNANRRRRIFTPFEAVHGETLDPAPGQDLVESSRQLSRLLKEAVRRLKPKYRVVILLKYVEEMSYDEIAAALSCSPGTVASRLSRALEILHERLRSFA